MKKIAFTILITLFSTVLTAQTIDECQQAAAQNYPLIAKYDLITKTTYLTVENIKKGHLPQITFSAQATFQSDVTAFPEQMQNIYRQAGIDMEGLKKDQYKIALDIQQTIYDGGAIKANRQIAEKQGEILAAQTETSLYQIRKRVSEMYFALLLIDCKIRQNNDLQKLLLSNENQLNSMLKNGTASESDFQSVKAERLNARQQLTDLELQQKTLKRMLSSFCGIEVAEVEIPDFDTAAPQSSVRPELKTIDANIQLTELKYKALDAALKPKFSVFAQGYYGYPGLNMFEDMMSRQFSLNGIIGARLSWNFSAFYTRKNDRAKLQIESQTAQNSREVFLFDNGMEQLKINDNIIRYRTLLDSDDEIIALRENVRKAAESKLSHGIIDVNALVKEINAENAARLMQQIHKIEMLKEIYDLKFSEGK